MTLMVYNSLTGDKTEFKPLHGNRVNMFVCGPTVYDHSHIGHARTYVVFDTIVRYLKYKGYSVFYIMNITDIDDKMIQKANEEGKEVKEVAERYTELFFQDMGLLGVDQVNYYGKATEHVPEILDQIKVLMDKGIAYPMNESVYFEVNKFEEFGKLSRQKLDMLQAGARVTLAEEKLNPEDFALWKAYKAGEPFWDSPYGKGRPGWHVEDTAISITYFGSQYDIHGGGRDLIFPHHDSEIAIAESVTGVKPFVKYWFHTGFLNVRGEKMSKSLGNFITIKGILERFEPEVLRFFLMYTHYRKPIDFDYELLDEAKAAYTRLSNTMAQLQMLAGNEGKEDPELLSTIAKRKAEFMTAMDDDFNTREAMAALFELGREVNGFIDKDRTAGFSQALETFKELGGILGLSFTSGQRSEVLSNLVEEMIKVREKARKSKDFATSDSIRDQLKKAGIVLEDGAEGTTWKLEQ